MCQSEDWNDFLQKKAETGKASSSKKSRSGKGPERAYSDVILPIKPEFVDLIAEGKKNHEYRRYRVRDTVQRLWLYEVGPSFKIRYVMETSRPKVPGEVNDPTGVGNDDFDAGKKAYKFGYPVKKLFKLPKPITMEQMRKEYSISVPQSFCYMTLVMFNKTNLTALEEVKFDQLP